MSYNLLYNFKLAFNKFLQNFLIDDYSYNLIDDCIYLHLNFKIVNVPLHIKITTRSLYYTNSLYLALYQSIIQYLNCN